MSAEFSNGSVDETDAQLIRAILDGDPRAFERLYRREVGRVHALCLRLTNHPAMAEELTQEAFVHAWRKLELFRGESKFSTWLYRLTTNLVLDKLRLKKHNFEKAMTELDDTIPTIGEKLDERRDLENGIASLPDGARTVFVLYELEGHSHEEIGNMIGVAPGTSKAQLHRAKKLLKNWLTT